MRARIKAYELAAKMQTAVPEVMDISKETAETQKLYGLDNATTADFGRQLPGRRGGWSSAACASCRSSTAAAAAAAGTRTAS